MYRKKKKRPRLCPGKVNQDITGTVGFQIMLCDYRLFIGFRDADDSEQPLPEVRLGIESVH